MARKIFVNLPVADLERSKRFFTALGFGINAQFSSELAASIVVSEDIYVMLLTHGHFNTFITLPIADATKATEVLVCLSADSRVEVDELADKAVSAGGKAHKEPMDHGTMYGRGFTDPDGHVWEVMWMDPSVIQKA